MYIPKLAEIRLALETKLYEILTAYFEAGLIDILPNGNPLPATVEKILVIPTISPGAMLPGEMAGKQGIVPRQGVMTVLLSCPVDGEKLTYAWQIAGSIEESFYRENLPIYETESEEEAGDESGEDEETDPDDEPQPEPEPEPVAEVMCNEPYVTNVGETPDKRLALSVTIPWWVWAGGKGE